MSEYDKPVLGPSQRDVDPLVVWDEPARTGSHSRDENYLVLASLRLVNRQHLDVLVLFDFPLQLGPLGSIKRNDGDILWIEIHCLQVHFGVDVFKPEDKEFFDRIALRLVAERGFDKSLRILFTNVDEDKRVLQI